MHTFSTNESPAVLEVFEEDGAGVIVHVDERNNNDGAVKSKSDVPWKHDHVDYNQYLNVIKLINPDISKKASHSIIVYS